MSYTLVKLTESDVSTHSERNSAFSTFTSPFICVSENCTDHVFFKNIHDPDIPVHTIKLASGLRPMLSPDKKYTVTAVDQPDMKYPVEKVRVKILGSTVYNISIDQAENLLEMVLQNAPLYVGQRYAFRVGAKGMLSACEITSLGYSFDGDYQEIASGLSYSSDLMSVVIDDDDHHFVETESRRLKRAFNPDNWSFNSIEIGGLNEELFTILRRAFLSRMMKPSLREKLRIKHTKGMLLYGPPGTGKTLIARKIGTLLGLKENDSRIRVVNGPELFSKWSGEAESQLRALFETKNSDLHILIFDEIEASARRRDSGSSSEITGRFVTQFLALLDGVRPQDNIFVIGMTNRKDLIDPAMLRPGRLEIHVEITLPDEAGRKEILLIHTASIRASGMMATVDIDLLAKKTKNFTGAEIEALVKSAVSFATTSQSKLTDISLLDTISVTKEDFEMAFTEIFPAFGATHEDLDKYVRYGLLPFPNLDPQTAVNYINHLPSTAVERICISGKHGTGCSAWAATIVTSAKYDFIKFITPSKYLELNEAEILRDLGQIFRDSYKSGSSLIVFDDLERLIRLTNVNGVYFSQCLLSGITTLLSENPPKNCKLVIVVTTHESPTFWSRAGVMFDRFFELPLITREELPDCPVKVLCAEMARK